MQSHAKGHNKIHKVQYFNILITSYKNQIKNVYVNDKSSNELNSKYNQSLNRQKKW